MFIQCCHYDHADNDEGLNVRFHLVVVLAVVVVVSSFFSLCTDTYTIKNTTITEVQAKRKEEKKKNPSESRDFRIGLLPIDSDAAAAVAARRRLLPPACHSSRIAGHSNKVLWASPTCRTAGRSYASCRRSAIARTADGIVDALSMHRRHPSDVYSYGPVSSV